LKISLFLDNIDFYNSKTFDSFLCEKISKYDISTHEAILLTISIFTDKFLNLNDFSIITKSISKALPEGFSPKSILLNNLKAPQLLIDMTLEIFNSDGVSDEKG